MTTLNELRNGRYKYIVPSSKDGQLQRPATLDIRPIEAADPNPDTIRMTDVQQQLETDGQYLAAASMLLTSIGLGIWYFFT